MPIQDFKRMVNDVLNNCRIGVGLQGSSTCQHNPSQKFSDYLPSGAQFNGSVQSTINPRQPVSKSSDGTKTVHVMPTSDVKIERPPRYDEHFCENAAVVGQPFKCHTFNLWVDGFCGSGDPTRFSLGSLGNIGRQAGVIPVRGQIGKGMQMRYDEGRTSIICLGESPLFVQAPLHATRSNDDTATVYRLAGVAECEDVDRFHKLFEEHV
ncbi:unnamed protein product [Angiostrongylus costaricensis]|uniref:MH2 domain-containing protein n=1 Tax=Angiostrongylus costaricensis TaxID=334426 RepID=A0A0R3PF73_ANGCS|nr:unnamed protein product [Angiostrongylus costaricensis]